jgi:hypothetical protein
MGHNRAIVKFLNGITDARVLFDLGRRWGASACAIRVPDRTGSSYDGEERQMKSWSPHEGGEA